jgi:hypothetical protein
MKQSVYSLLDRDARGWWYHRQLRDQGKPEEARQLERRSIRDHVKTLRSAYYASVGRGGWSIHCHKVTSANGLTSQSTLEGYGDASDGMIKACIVLGLPVVDTTTISDEAIYDTISIPLVAIDRPCDPEPYHGMSYAPLEYVISAYRKLGATVYNSITS